MKKILLPAITAVALLAPHAAVAQGGPGFLFNRPRVSVGLRTGYVLPTLASPLFDDARDWYNLNRFDFDGPYLGGEIAARVSERWDVAFAAGWSRATSRSHYRDFVEEVGGERLEIEQDNRFQLVSATLGGRYYFTDRGREIGRFAWVPAGVSPFVGAGVGMTWYELEQVGDFVDQGDPACPEGCPIYTDVLATDGSGAAVHAGLGADISVGKQFYLTVEGRYSLASAGVSGQFAAYDDIDLSGLQLITGVSLRW